MKTADVFQKRKIKYTFIFLTIAALFWISSAVAQFQFFDSLTSIPKALYWMATNLIPDQKAWTRLPKIMGKLVETALLSVAATMVSGICAFAFSLLGSGTVKGGGWSGRVVRMIAAFFRNVPDVVWAMLLMFSFGQNILTGFLALFFMTFGLLTRAFIETIDEVSADCVEALEATGATFGQIIFQGVIPSSIPGLMTWILYMIETNIRSSTLIGILTATGIGYLFDLYYKRLDFGSASLVVISIVALVIAIETISNKIRKVIL